MNDTLLGRTFSGPELAEAAGLSYRRVDYYTRVGLLAPVVRGLAGPGSRRVYDQRDLARVKLIGALRALGADLDVASRVLAALDPDPQQWPAYFFVEPDGRVRIGLPLPAACWWISTAELLHERALESTAA